MKYRILTIGLLLGTSLIASCNQSKSNEITSINPPSEVFASINNQDILDDIKYIEDNVIMPQLIPFQGKVPNKSEYERFYAVKDSPKGPIIHGIYILGFESYPIASKVISKLDDYDNVYLVLPGNLPLVTDGGCSVISVYFNLETKTLDGYLQDANPEINQVEKFANGYCNGVA